MCNYVNQFAEVDRPVIELCLASDFEILTEYELNLIELENDDVLEEYIDELEISHAVKYLLSKEYFTNENDCLTFIKNYIGTVSELTNEDIDDFIEDYNNEQENERFMERTEGFDINYRIFECNCPEFLEEPCECGTYFRERLMSNIRWYAQPFIQRSLVREHKKYFSSIIAEELIAAALHPRRMMMSMNEFDDIEDFFTAMAC
jgi:hypothetical protein